MKWQPTASGRSQSTWMNSPSATITTTTSFPINGSTPCLRSLSSFGTCTKVAFYVWKWDIVHLKIEQVRGAKWLQFCWSRSGFLNWETAICMKQGSAHFSSEDSLICIFLFKLKGKKDCPLTARRASIHTLPEVFRHSQNLKCARVCTL